MPTRRSHHRPAAVLILAMLLMSAIIGSSIALSVVISDSGHQTQILNNYIAASIAADSGLERGLAVVKLGRVDQTLANTKTAITPSVAIDDTTISGSSPSNNSLSWPRLLPRETVTFDYVKGASLTDDEKKITLHGTSITGELDISWIGLGSDNSLLFTGRKFFTNNELVTVNSGTVNLVDATNNLYNIDGSPINSNVGINSVFGFRIRITATEDNIDLVNNPLTKQIVTNLTVSGKDPTTNPIFPSRILISSTGQVNNSQAAKSVSVPWILPTSPIFNYVLFAEGNIIPELP